MSKNIFFYILIILLLVFNNIPVQANTKTLNIPNDLNYDSSLKEYILFVPTGTSVNAILSQEINSNSAVTGQSVNAILTQDFKYNGQLIASGGSIVSGAIVSNRKAGPSGKDAQIQIRFTTITTPYNNVIPVSAIISTSNLTGILKGSELDNISKEYEKSATKSNYGNIISAAIDTGSKDDANDENHKATLGGGIGIVKTAISKGKDIVISANTSIKLVFDQPITLGAQ